ncbi:GMC family oxidoreductase N-terminal domain-containing protein [Actinoplanes sp. CA-252034]|uniref:GMC family oxidoreductase N-terminal domain-containing protein n=1 Tax=Actinoplanes sp. CA-252034 TaxID=3239906 RepID=UPI003D95AD65
MSVRGGASRRVTVVDCDVLVIGSGAGGSVAARELAAAGRDVTVVEEGPRVTTAEIAARPPAENLRCLYRNGGLTPIFGKPMIAYGEGRCVGGTTVVNGGLLWAPPADLLDRWAAESGIGGYRAEHLTTHLDTIAGRLGATMQTDGDGNRDSGLLADGADRLGWRWQYARRAIRGCRHSNRCTTGCPTGAKQSMAQTYLPDAEAFGARVVADRRVTRMRHAGGLVREVHAVDHDGRRWAYRPRDVFLAAGPVNSAVLLQRSGIQRRSAAGRMAFHVNMRTIAEFSDRVDATDGTIFTRQVHHFARDRVLIMPSNVTAGGLGAAVAAKPYATAESLISGLDRIGVYTTQVAMSGTVRIHSGRLGVVLRHRMTAADHAGLRRAFASTARVLFAAGARRLHAPVPAAPPLSGVPEAEQVASAVADGAWELISVHGMASCRMGRPERGGVCDDRGRPYGMRNLRLCDASVLPGVTGISPQGAVMAFSHEIVSRFLAG